MKSLLLHCKKFNSSITGISTRGVEVAPEAVSKNRYDHDDCIVAFITVEASDDLEKISPRMAKEILKFLAETKESRAVIAPFAHLSSKLAPFKVGITFFDMLERLLREQEGLEVDRVHFGSDKELLLHLFGHPGNVRFREF